ncbi:MAG: hypothetical protein V1720_13505 [bacterium]
MKLKKYIALFLAVLVILHSGFQLLIFKVFEAKYKHEIKKMIEAGIDEKDLIRLVFPKDIKENPITGFEWKKKNEFRFQGEMYDIVKRKYFSDSIYFYCIHDKKESKLFASLEKYVQTFLEKNPSKGKEFNIISSQLSKLYPAPAAGDFIFNIAGKTEFGIFIQNKFFDTLIAPLTPPPQDNHLSVCII